MFRLGRSVKVEVILADWIAHQVAFSSTPQPVPSPAQAQPGSEGENMSRKGPLCREIGL